MKFLKAQHWASDALYISMILFYYGYLNIYPEK